LRGTDFIRLAALAVLLLAAALGRAQDPRGNPHGVPSPTLPDLEVPAAPSVVPDTAVAVFSLPEDFPVPSRVMVRPDSVFFGGIVQVILEHDAGGGTPPVILENETAWLEAPTPEEPGRVARFLGRKTDSLPPNAFRVYRTDPFRIQVGSVMSGVIHVRGRAEGTDQVAGIRTPPFPGLPWPTILAGALLLGLVFLLAAWLWGRRHGPVVWPDRPVGTPAWLETATGLDKLIQGGALARGEGSRFLDGLASLARRYMAGRYGVAASEMTGREIVAACRALGYPLGPVRALAGLIDEADRRRYDPDPPLPAWCREQAVGFYTQVQATRVIPRQSPVTPQRILAAEQAWSAVARELDPTGRLRADQNRGGAF